MQMAYFLPFYKCDNFCDFLCCFSTNLTLSLKGSTVKEKNLLPREQNTASDQGKHCEH